MLEGDPSLSKFEPYAAIKCASKGLLSFFIRVVAYLFQVIFEYTKCTILHRSRHSSLCLNIFDLHPAIHLRYRPIDGGAKNPIASEDDEQNTTAKLTKSMFNSLKMSHVQVHTISIL
ncbi:hypothetical protein M8C21_030598 [Ambrosia artemisiifolia]|uniref:Uncharacterized protein n=1 Tax=Ambrosia artemisiifolia TaxID=4212 RepID=A0AAD5CRK0_AMBAR|nr:hypothetical protein M8C21_030598 [Ambrosia artemisiifolia]